VAETKATCHAANHIYTCVARIDWDRYNYNSEFNKLCHRYMSDLYILFALYLCWIRVGFVLLADM